MQWNKSISFKRTITKEIENLIWNFKKALYIPYFVIVHSAKGFHYTCPSPGECHEKLTLCSYVKSMKNLIFSPE